MMTSGPAGQRSIVMVEAACVQVVLGSRHWPRSCVASAESTWACVTGSEAAVGRSNRCGWSVRLGSYATVRLSPSIASSLSSVVE